MKEALFVDGFSLFDKKFENSNFFHAYQKVFKERPGIFAAQAYDTGLIIKKIIDDGETSRVGMRDKLAAINKFDGSLGNLKLNPQREFQRPIMGFEVATEQIRPYHK